VLLCRRRRAPVKSVHSKPTPAYEPPTDPYPAKPAKGAGAAMQRPLIASAAAPSAGGGGVGRPAPAAAKSAVVPYSQYRRSRLDAIRSDLGISGASLCTLQNPDLYSGRPCRQRAQPLLCRLPWNGRLEALLQCVGLWNRVCPVTGGACSPSVIPACFMPGACSRSVRAGADEEGASAVWCGTLFVGLTRSCIAEACRDRSLQ